MTALLIALVITLPPLGLAGVIAIGLVMASTRITRRRGGNQ